MPSRTRSTRAVHLEWFAMATLALDVPFSIWPRLLTTSGEYSLARFRARFTGSQVLRFDRFTHSQVLS